jgi:hypothetical protein
VFCVAFRPDDISEFRYLSAALDRSTGEAHFGFALVGASVDGAAIAESFTERITFTLPTDSSSTDWERVEALIPLLGAVLGLSYYKAAAPVVYSLQVPGLTDATLAFLALTLKHGLGEFAYRAGLPGLLEPQITRGNDAAPAPVPIPVLVPIGAPLVPIGGGKDSVVTIESLLAAGLLPVQFAVNANPIIRRVAGVKQLPLITATRTLDKRLLELNAEGARNGHVPVTAMNSLIAVIQSRLLGLGPVVMSNESSASDPTLIWNGEPVNHQWSKSVEAERALIAVLRDQAGLEHAYFSLLRPFSELRIAGGFAATEGYDAAIVSCNRAFRLGTDQIGWCGDCDKCRFVFLMFSTHMAKHRVVSIIGKDMLDDPTQLEGFRALLGLGAHKPFECVGEEAESSVAMSLASRNPEWETSAVVTALLAEIPTLREGSVNLERHVLAESPTDSLPEPYEGARRALI